MEVDTKNRKNERDSTIHKIMHHKNTNNTIWRWARKMKVSEGHENEHEKCQ